MRETVAISTYLTPIRVKAFHGAHHLIFWRLFEAEEPLTARPLVMTFARSADKMASASLGPDGGPPRGHHRN